MCKKLRQLFCRHEWVWWWNDTRQCRKCGKWEQVRPRVQPPRRARHDRWV